MRAWLSVLKGVMAVGLVMAVLGILFVDFGVVTDVPWEYFEQEMQGSTEIGSGPSESAPEIRETKEQDSQNAEETGCGQLIVETYTAEPTTTETYTAELTLSEQQLIERGKVIYLTFDDGPTRHTAELLDILAKYNVKATFFVTGESRDYVGLIGRAKEEGHTVGIHCFYHDYKTVYASEQAYFADMQMIDDLIFEQTGERAELVRFPGGSSNQVSRFNKGIMTRLTKLVEEKGYRYFDWNVLSGDAGETRETAEIIQNIKEGILKKDIAVVLQHDIYDYSIAAVEAIIVWGMENGYVFLPLTMDSPTIHHPIAN